MAENELFWDQLLGYVEAGQVVPVIGQDLLLLDSEGHERFQTRIAGALGEYLGVPAGELPPEPSLNDVARHYLKGHVAARRDDIYSGLKQVVGRQNFAIPEPILKLAEIRHFKLFLTTTFDPFLDRALKEVYSKKEIRTYPYWPEKPIDLPLQWQPTGAPEIFHLFGRLSTNPSYAVTEDDVLEFMHALASESRRPNRLLDRLAEAHLLILGCRFDDWLARFFLRATSRDRLWKASNRHYLADEMTLDDKSLVDFLESFSPHIRLFRGQGAVELVNELHKRWKSAHPLGEIEAPEETSEVDPEMPPGAVFLSYARDDIEIARKVQAALKSANIDVWFDKKNLEWGDKWEQKIRRCIRSCTFFLPIISAQALTDDRRRFFRIEWRLAETEAQKVKISAEFLLPLVIDSTSPDHRDVPEIFREADWSSFKSDDDLPSLVAKVTELVRSHKRRLAGRRIL